MKRLVIISLLLATTRLFAAGTLTPQNAGSAPIQIREHLVDVVIDNGFARTEVTQTFFNPNAANVEAIYSFPVPQSASLSEITIWNGDRVLNGEVIDANDASKVYTEERDSGNDAGLGQCSCTKKKDEVEYASYKFSIANVRAQSETKIRFVYYQPLKIEGGFGRYVYPLAEGGTDDSPSTFWTRNTQVEKRLAISVELRSGWPVDQVQAQGAENDAKITKLDAGHYKVAIDRTSGDLTHDFVFYYRLAENLPGRVELMTYKPNANEPGTFMLTLTPGSDLGRIGESAPQSATPNDGAMTYNETMTVSATAGADYVFVLDVSGSMSTKLATLARGVKQALSQFKTGDRFRIITFNESASELTNGFVDANAVSIEEWSNRVMQLRTGSGTNVYAGLKAGLDAVEADRACSVLLITDGVANEGIVDPPSFYKLLKNYDVRVFGFLMGNQGNWPLMRLITETSGGFYDQGSNDGDIGGAILLAKSKIVSEAIHDVKLPIDGVRTEEATTKPITKLYRGQQLVIFGRYDKGGPARVKLAAKMTGPDETYDTTFDFPEVSREYPELERLWAMERVENAIMNETIGIVPAKEAEQAIRDLGVKYQLVTDYTSMVVLSDGDFAKRGIARSNRDRTAIERTAQASRMSAAPQSARVDQSRPMFNGHAHATRGGGAIDPINALLIAIGAFAVIKAASQRS